MGRHQWRGTVGENQHWQKEIVVHWEGLFRKITKVLQLRWTAAELNIHVEDPVSTKRVQRELHKSNIHSRAAIAKPLITESNVQTRKRWCHNHQTTGNARVIWSDESSFMLFPMSGRVYVWRTPTEAYNPECLISTVNHEGCPMIVWAAISWYSNLLVPYLSFMAELLQGSRWTGWLIRCIPWSRRYFRTTMQFSKTTIPHSHSWNCSVNSFKSMKVNSNIFPGQNNCQIWTSLNHSAQFWRTEWATNSHVHHL
jgi:hypothetical protein